MSNVCSLQDEKAWLHGMDSVDEDRCWDEMAQHAKHVDQFVAVSQWYADECSTRMNIPAEKMNVVPLGIELALKEDQPTPPDPPVLGYLSKMTVSLGLGRLVEAFIELKKNPALNQLKLRATGGQLGADADYVAKLKDYLTQHGVGKDVEFLEAFEPDQRRDFLRTLSVLSVPAEDGEAFGMYIPEALAQGVPVVQPRAGGFTEVVEATQGGLLYDVESSDGLLQALETLLLDPERAQAMGQRGKKVVLEHYSIDHMAENIVALYKEMV